MGRVFAWGGSLHGGEDLRGKNWGGSEAGEGCKMCQSEWDDHKVFGKDPAIRMRKSQCRWRFQKCVVCSIFASNWNALVV